jgi:hypothetical protein
MKFRRSGIPQGKSSDKFMFGGIRRTLISASEKRDQKDLWVGHKNDDA